MSFGVRFNLDDLLDSRRKREVCPVTGPTVFHGDGGEIRIVFAKGEPVPCYRCKALVPADEHGHLPEHEAADGVSTAEWLRVAAAVRLRGRNAPRA